MTTPTPRKPLNNATNPSPGQRRGLSDNSPGRPPSSTNTTSAALASGLGRTPSLRQARPGRRVSARMSTSYADGDTDDMEDQKNDRAQVTAQLEQEKELNAQTRQENLLLRSKLEIASDAQTALEEREFQKQTELDRLQAEVKDLARQMRDKDTAHLSDTRLLVQGHEKLTSEAAELQSKNERLHEMLRNNGLEKSYANRAPSVPDPIPPNNEFDSNLSGVYERKLKEKDAAIETLQFQLAESQFNQTEEVHSGEGRIQALQKEAMELRMEKARLQEENESFQVLLGEKTLKGDFLPDFHESTGMSTLAEELESFDDDLEPQSEGLHKIEIDNKKLIEANKKLQDSNKALTLYIDKIVGRILQHDGFEHIIKDNVDASDMPPPPPAKSAHSTGAEKALPPPPGSEGATPPSTSTMQNAAAGFLQRAKSVVSRNNTGRPSRPMSYAQPVPPTANENPETAPSIPLNRGHRRARSDQAQQDLGAGAAAVVAQMNRGSPLRTVSGGPLSPGISPLSPQLPGKPGYFPSLSQASTRAPSNSQQGTGQGSSRNSITSDHSQERSSTDASSAHATAPAAAPAPGPSAGPAIPGAVMKQNQLRPLRLVQAQTQEDDNARKRANRGSWVGWFRGDENMQ